MRKKVNNAKMRMIRLIMDVRTEESNNKQTKQEQTEWSTNM